ncbi:1-acyl-sn-glycerol-3-phosphate acyltransferase [Tunicatimonas pelagia]|uniref:1-acyl-sn-glycerol-3-phosphate acyltransferase n=1 Tax=Tunicatimonas pelagia TaxID=931531 RepID=UPI00266529FE|nr:1-acyl-sn-glycerol-3-phosphate acyltransferase [Tunicatimonas pelagia]WKN42056.1 1-acyl-sn-glycerol-3-phosphate acyltransferase [Tunicatimonas pelagia]
MWKIIAKIILGISGWSYNKNFPKHIKKGVMIAAPHTSNWDIFYALSALRLMGIPIRFTIKKEWMKPPVGIILKALGAIPINRKQKGLTRESMVDAMARLFDERDHLIVLVTPEGTRKYAKRWRTGFYHVAKQANVPILLGYLDYAQKEAGILMEPFYPSDDVNQDIEAIKEKYKGFTARHPEQGIY